MFQEVISQKIPPAYWVNASLDETKFADATTNDEIVTYGLSIQRRLVPDLGRTSAEPWKRSQT
jgi:hypothetical protein